MEIPQPEGNYFNKYKDNGKIVNFIMSEFFRHLDFHLGRISFENMYEAGCGEGYISQHVLNNKPNIKITASDISKKVINQASIDFPDIVFKYNSIYSLEEENNSFDLVIACEVLEHLDKPESALEELFRISKKYFFISVPNEPIWCIANSARGKYLKSQYTGTY